MHHAEDAHAPLDPTNTADAPRPPHPAQLGHTCRPELIHAELRRISPRRPSYPVPAPWQAALSHSFMRYSAYFLQQADLSRISHVLRLRTWLIWDQRGGCLGARRLAARIVPLGADGPGFFLRIPGLAPEWCCRRQLLATGVAVIYQFTVGTVCYPLVGELSTQRLLIKPESVLGRNG
ncbi:hypothetical protein C8J57DRAFT_311733 [Mycena rebaudengoi]|nr:hypothetical protein C8J57DRAFT_311733 [Mycena rebaudengoi]